jgi:hypothetical protein
VDVALLLIAVSGLFAVLLSLNQIVQTIRGQARIGFIHTSLAFLVALVALAALIVNNLEAAPLFLVETAVFALAGLLIVLGILLLLFERRRPERLKQSRGLLSLGIGLLLVIANIGVPFIAAYTLLAVQPSPTPTPLTAAAVPTSRATQTGEQRARSVFSAVLKLLAEQTGLDEDTIVRRLDKGDTIADLAQETGANPEAIVKGVSDIMRAEIRKLSAENRMNSVQAALVISQMEGIVRLGLNRSFRDSRLGQFLGRGTPEAPTLAVGSTTTPALAASPTPSRTPFPTFTPTLSRTPAPSPTPSATRFRFVTSTPAPTATLPDPCLALTRYNVNLRKTPDLKAERLATIPFNTSVTLFARSADSTWWLAKYDDQTGWLKGEFLNVSNSCARLPVNEAE